VAVYKQINKENLVQFLQALTKERTLIAPVEEDGIVSYKPVQDAKQITYAGQNSLVPPKKWFFPQSELLFSFTFKEGKFELSEPASPSGAVLFGVRPCDLKAILSLDPVFDGKFKDSYYGAKRENTVVIGLGCSSVERKCFCFAVGGGPTEAEGADIFLTPDGEGYLVEALTDKGVVLVEKNKQYFTDGGSDQQAKKLKKELADKLIKQAARAFELKFDLPKVKKLLDNNFELPYWDELSYRCLGCGICTYLCPTCHCFDVADYARAVNEGVRIRCWDSCQFKDFTLMAGGHNPRAGKKERIRNRFMHKFKYHEDRYGLFGCVGCGRCVDKCPVNIDPRKIILDLQEVAGNE